MIIFGVQGIIFPLELFPRFILHRASPPFCSRYIFSSPLLVQLAVQGRNLLETSFLSTSSPLRLPFNLFLRPFLRLRFRSSRSSSSSWIFSPRPLPRALESLLRPYSFFSFFIYFTSPQTFPSKSSSFSLSSPFFSLFTFNYFPLQELYIFFPPIVLPFVFSFLFCHNLYIRIFFNLIYYFFFCVINFIL